MLAEEAIALDCPLSIIAGLALVYPKALFDYIGVALVVVVLATQKLRKDESRPAALT